jgi:hypothetical protein
MPMTISRKKAAIIGVILAVAIPMAIYTISPIFVSKEVNEPLPDKFTTANTPDEFETFMALSEDQRFEKAQHMTLDEKNVVMKGAAAIDGNIVNENMTEAMSVKPTILVGTFVGVNDGIHNAQGLVKIIPVGEEMELGDKRILRLENFKATNGPDLYVYLSTDKSASDFVSLGRLKGNIGNQNYDIPDGTDLSKYDTVLIWCRAFSVLFGSAELTAQ